MRSFRHTVCNFTQNIDLHCFFARPFLSLIHALLSVKFSGQKMCECKKIYKYEVWGRSYIMYYIAPFIVQPCFHPPRAMLVLESEKENYPLLKTWSPDHYHQHCHDDDDDDDDNKSGVNSYGGFSYS